MRNRFHRDRLLGQPEFFQPRVDRCSLQILHREVGGAVQIASCNEARYVRTLQYLEQLMLNLKADNIFSAVALAHQRHFHHHRE